MRYISCTVLLLACGWFSNTLVHAQPLTLLDTLDPNLSEDPEQDPLFGPQFGYSLASDGGTLLIGMPTYIASQEFAPGAVEKYRRTRDEWHRVEREDFQHLGNAVQVGQCGTAVAISHFSTDQYQEHRGCPEASTGELTGNGLVSTLVVAPGDPKSIISSGIVSYSSHGGAIDATWLNDGTGVYVVGEPGNQTVRIRQTGGGSEYEADIFYGGPLTRLGYSVAIDSGGPTNAQLWVAAGAPDENNYKGAVHIFYFDGLTSSWNNAGSISLPDGESGDLFGYSVAFSTGQSLLDPLDDLLVVGAPNRGSRGTVSVFRNDGSGSFTHEGNVVLNFTVCGSPSNCDHPMAFGTSVAIDERDRIWVGAPYFQHDVDVPVGRVYMASWGPLFSSPDAWYARSYLSPGPLSDDCGLLGSAQPEGLFGWSLAPINGGIAVGYPQRGCQANTIPPQPGPRRGQVRIYGVPSALFSDRFEQP